MTAMRLVLLVSLVLGTVVCGATTIQDEDDQVLVPSDVLRFILGCQRDAFGEPSGPLPVYHTDIDTDTGTTSQKVTLLDMDQLRQSLRSSVHSEEVLELIIGQLSAAMRGVEGSDSNSLRHEGIHSSSDINSTTGECTINNKIEISVPAQEVDSFNDRVQMIIQQNSFLLLEQINTLFTYKLRSLREDFGNMVRERTKKINRKLDAVLRALGTTAPVEAMSGEEVSPPPVVDGGLSPPVVAVSEPTTDSSEVETTDAPGVAEVEHESQEVETTEPTAPEDTSVEVDGGEEKAPSIRNAIPRPVPVVTNTYNRGRPFYRGSRPARYESAAGAAPADRSRQTERQQLRQSFLNRQRKRTRLE